MKKIDRKLAAVQRANEKHSKVDSRVRTKSNKLKKLGGSPSSPVALSEFKSEFFKALASPLRIRILDELRDGEHTVTELKDRLGVEPSNVSQQLAILRSKNLVVGRKQSSNIYYKCTDPAIFELLDVAKRIFNNHLVDLKNMLEVL